MSFDLVIRNARVVDGTGAPWRWADVAVSGPSVVAIGREHLGGARRVIDADGRVLAPGFIDLHSHSERQLLAEPTLTSAISQGVTTILVGQDGLGVAPVRERSAARVAALVQALVGTGGDWDHGDVAAYLARVDRRAAVNVATLVPYGTLRCDLLHGEDRPATPSELEDLASSAERAMDDGAFGLSTGLEYEPQTACTTAELVHVMRRVARRNGIYMTHIRDYDEGFVASLEEAIAIGRVTGAPVQLSHLHCYGPRNHGRAAEIAALLDRARRDGIDVTFDIYPYTASATYAHYFAARRPEDRQVALLRAQIADPAERRRLSDRINRDGLPNDATWDDCYPAAGGQTIGASGRSLGELARLRGVSGSTLLLDLISATDFAASLNVITMAADDVDATLCSPLATVGSDGVLLGERPHPRGWGSFAKVLREYVRERELLSLEDAVALLSGRAAARLGLPDRGVIRIGARADLVMFDPGSVHDQATYKAPRQPATGIDVVVTNGIVVWENHGPTGATSGEALRPPSKW